MARKERKVKNPAVLVKAALLALGNEEQIWIWPLVGHRSLGLFAFIPSMVEILWPLELWINELERAGAAGTWFLQHEGQREAGWGPGLLEEPEEQVPEPAEMSWGCQGSTEGCQGITEVKHPAV